MKELVLEIVNHFFFNLYIKKNVVLLTKNRTNKQKQNKNQTNPKNKAKQTNQNQILKSTLGQLKQPFYQWPLYVAPLSALFSYSYKQDQVSSM